MKDQVVRVVSSFYEENGRGMTRAELAKAIDWPQTRNLPGVRAAIDEHLICYDGSPESRLIPWDAFTGSEPSDG